MIPVVELPHGAARIALGALPVGGLAALTVEGWFRVAAISAMNRPLLLQYGATGQAWALYVTLDGRAYFVVWDDAGVNVGLSPAGAVTRGRWVHVAGCYDGSWCGVWVNGLAVTDESELSGGEAGGAVVDPAGQAAQIGGTIGENAVGFCGRVGWCRVSDVVRYPAPLRGPDLPPATDAHTLGLWQMLEGSGATVANAQGTAAFDGVITGGSWGQSVTSDKWRCRAPVVGSWGRARRPLGPAAPVARGGLYA